MDALAAIGSTSSLIFLVIGWLNGITSGFAIIIAQQFGAKRYDRMRHYLAQSIYLCVAFVVVMTIGLSILNYPILRMMNTPETIIGETGSYMAVIYAGLVVTAAYNALAAVLRALGDGKSPLYFLIISAVLNIIMDIVFIVYFRMGVVGCGYATVIAQAVSALLCLLYIIKKFDILRLHKPDFEPSARSMGQLLAIGIPMGLQFSITAIGSMVMQSTNNGLGSIYVSGFTAGMRIKQFAMCPFDALANGVSVFCSQNLGAGKIKRIRKGLWQGVGVGFIYGLLIGLVLIFAGRSLSMLFISADQTAVLDASAKYLRCLGFFYWSLGPLSVFRMSAQGMGFSGRAIFSGVTEMIARTFVSFAFVGTYGFTAICFADQTAWVSATLYITPVCLMCLRQVTREHERQQAKIAD